MTIISAGRGVDDRGRLRVEIIVCTFNGEKYIAEQLRSIFSQSRKPDLISVYDDTSSDRTVEIVRETFEQSGPADVEFRIVKNERNLGYVGNFSQGIKEAKADILFLCDQDDRWHRTKIETLLNLLNKTKSDLVFSDGNLIDSDGEEISGKSVLGHYGMSNVDISKFADHAVARLARRNYINGAAMAIRREAAVASMPIPAGLPHDYWLAIWCALHGGISALPQCLYDYRQHSNNVIGVGLNKWYYVWYGILRSPRAPRLIEYARYLELVPRVSALQNASIFVKKLHWLEACVVQKGRMSRFLSILGASVSGQYARFGAGHAWLRDVIAVIRTSK